MIVSVSFHRIADMKMNFEYDDISKLIMMEVCQEMYDKGFEFSVCSVENKIKEFIISNNRICPIVDKSIEDNMTEKYTEI